MPCVTLVTAKYKFCFADMVSILHVEITSYVFISPVEFNTGEV